MRLAANVTAPRRARTKLLEVQQLTHDPARALARARRRRKPDDGLSASPDSGTPRSLTPARVAPSAILAITTLLLGGIVENIYGVRYDFSHFRPSDLLRDPKLELLAFQELAGSPSLRLGTRVAECR
jgi:hypothetical protein